MVEPNGTLILQFLNFFILVALLGKFAYKPLLRVMQERRDKIEEDLAEAAKAEENALALQEESKQALLAAHAEAKAIISRAKQQAEDVAQAHLEELNAQIAREKEMAQQEIAAEKERAHAALQNEIITLSVAVAEKLLLKEISTEVDDRLIQEAIGKIDSKGAGI